VFAYYSEAWTNTSICVMNIRYGQTWPYLRSLKGSNILTKEAENWLKENGFKLGEDIDPNTVPIFFTSDPDRDPEFVPGYGSVGGGQRGKFIAEAPSGFWLGGGSVIIYVRVDGGDAAVAIPDRRHGGNLGPTAQGWAKYAEGLDLAAAALRELVEEIDVYTLGGEGDGLYQPCKEIVPAGCVTKGRVDSLNLDLDAALTFGKVCRSSYCKNTKDRAYIYVGLWDLREVPEAHRLRVVWEDDFPKGLRPGTNPRVISLADGKELGTFEGAQGYIPRGVEFHPVMQDLFGQ